MADVPEVVRTAWQIAEMVCELGSGSTALVQGRHAGVAEYHDVKAAFDGADLVRLRAPGLELVLRRYLKATDGSFVLPVDGRSGYVYRFENGDVVALEMLRQDLLIMRSSSALPALPAYDLQPGFAAAS